MCDGLEPSHLGTASGPPVRFRPMAPADVDVVVALEVEAFSTPWSARTFRELMERDAVELWVGEAELPAGETHGRPAQVAHGPAGEDGSQVMAYAVLWCMGGDGELANLAVSPAFRGQGIGGRFLDRLLGVAAHRGVQTLYLEVRESNAAARALYRSRGFREIGRRKRYYERPVEDARVLALGLDPPGPAIER